jgi:GntP family gluconate:H+ symporter
VVTRWKLNAFIALLLAALILGAGSGMALPDVLKHFQDGLGATLGGTAAVIGLGVMLGKLLAESVAPRFSRNASTSFSALNVSAGASWPWHSQSASRRGLPSA